MVSPYRDAKQQSRAHSHHWYIPQPEVGMLRYIYIYIPLLIYYWYSDLSTRGDARAQLTWIYLSGKQLPTQSYLFTLKLVLIEYSLFKVGIDVHVVRA